MRRVTVTKSALTRIDTDKLQEIRAQMAKAKGAYVKVGLLGQDSNRGEALNNPTLGLIHEEGSASAKPPVPRRSFLKEPLMAKLPEEIQAKGPVFWRKALLDKGVLYSLGVLGVQAENVVQEGFATGGFGRWKPLAPSTVRKKGSTAILIESSKMRKAVHSAVVKK